MDGLLLLSVDIGEQLFFDVGLVGASDAGHRHGCTVTTTLAEHLRDWIVVEMLLMV